MMEVFTQFHFLNFKFHARIELEFCWSFAPTWSKYQLLNYYIYSMQEEKVKPALHATIPFWISVPIKLFFFNVEEQRYFA